MLSRASVLSASLRQPVVVELVASALESLMLGQMQVCMCVYMCMCMCVTFIGRQGSANLCFLSFLHASTCVNSGCGAFMLVCLCLIIFGVLILCVCFCLPLFYVTHIHTYIYKYIHACMHAHIHKHIYISCRVYTRRARDIVSLSLSQCILVGLYSFYFDRSLSMHPSKFHS